MSKIIFSTCALAAAFLAADCRLLLADEGVTEDFHSSYNMGPGGRLHVSNRNGSLEVVGWDRNSVDVSGTKYAPEREALRDVKVDIQQSGDTLDIRTRTPEGSWWHFGNSGARFRIRVPRRFILDRVETTNGSITAEDIEGGGYVKSTNGKLTFARLTGDYHVETTNGSIEMDECSGTERAETTNGQIRGRLRSGTMDAHSTNGSIDLTLLKPQEGRPVKVSTTNGALRLAMAEFHANPISAETTHGSVTLRLPSDTNGRIDASTSLANISSDLPLTSTENQSKHRLSGRFGSGGPSIEASTSTGSIHIERY